MVVALATAGEAAAVRKAATASVIARFMVFSLTLPVSFAFGWANAEVIRRALRYG
jgi:hypothetical protein